MGSFTCHYWHLETDGSLLWGVACHHGVFAACLASLHKKLETCPAVTTQNVPAQDHMSPKGQHSPCWKPLLETPLTLSDTSAEPPSQDVFTCGLSPLWWAHWCMGHYSSPRMVFPVWWSALRAGFTGACPTQSTHAQKGPTRCLMLCCCLLKYLIIFE